MKRILIMLMFLLVILCNTYVYSKNSIRFINVYSFTLDTNRFYSKVSVTPYYHIDNKELYVYDLNFVNFGNEPKPSCYGNVWIYPSYNCGFRIPLLKLPDNSRINISGELMLDPIGNNSEVYMSAIIIGVLSKSNGMLLGLELKDFHCGKFVHTLDIFNSHNIQVNSYTYVSSSYEVDYGEWRKFNITILKSGNNLIFYDSINEYFVNSTVTLNDLFVGFGVSKCYVSVTNNRCKFLPIYAKYKIETLSLSYVI